MLSHLQWLHEEGLVSHLLLPLSADAEWAARALTAVSAVGTSPLTADIADTAQQLVELTRMVGWLSEGLNE